MSKIGRFAMHIVSMSVLVTLSMHPDIATANQDLVLGTWETSFTPKLNQVCLGDGSGAFSCSDVDDSIPELSVTTDVALGDLNNDGDLDAVFATEDPAFNAAGDWACLGNGSGALSCEEIDAPTRSFGVALGDLNGDGKLDAVFATIGRNRVCLGDGSGRFVCEDVSTSRPTSWGVALGDVDHDRRLDAVFANDDQFESNQVCLGDGGGGLLCGDVSPDRNQSLGIALGDVDGDGNLDAVFANSPDPAVDTLRNRACFGNGSGEFVCDDVSTDENNTHDVSLGDVNNDGKLDAVFANWNQPNKKCLGDGTGGFHCEDLDIDATMFDASSAVALEDLTGDGNLDAVFGSVPSSSTRGGARACLGNGTGDFSCSDIADTIGAWVRGIGVGDLDGSSTLEVEVDIKPGSYPNGVNPRSRGVIPVAILGSEDFDVKDVDVTTLAFGPAGAAPWHDLTDEWTYNEHLEDLNLDGYVDLVGHYSTQATGILCGDAEAALGGELVEGGLFQGIDEINTVGCPLPE